MFAKQVLRSVNGVLSLFGVNLRRMALTAKRLPGFFADLRRFKASKAGSANKDLFPIIVLNPSLEDRYSESGMVKGHYFHQDLLVAQRVSANRPRLHVDIGSRVDGFIAHVAAFRRIVVFDVRPLSSGIRNVEFIRADISTQLDNSMLDYCDSISCLHALEHFGLGRYGDLINYDGHLVGLLNIHKILQKGGKFYLSVPIGPQRIEFNAHRVFSIQYLVRLLQADYSIDRFSFIDDNGDLHEIARIDDAEAKHNLGCNYGCGIFEMTKL